MPGFAVLLAIVLSAGGVLAMTAGAADPNEGSVSLEQVKTGWNGKQYASGMTSLPEANTVKAACTVPGDELCDHFDLNVDIDQSHWESSNGGVQVQIAWESESDDFDLYVFDAAGNAVGSSASAGTSSERVFIDDASGEYQVRVVPWDVTDSGYAGGAWVESRAQVGGDVPQEPLSNTHCREGLAGPFPCKNVKLQSFMPLSTIGGGNLNDIWGWTDPKTGREYALVGKTSGTAFVDITSPTAPVYLGDLPSHQPVETIFNTWRDIKVYENRAFIGSEEPGHGLQVFDLTRLRGASGPKTWTEDTHYSFNLDGPGSIDPVGNLGNVGQGDNSHNIAINEDSGFLYAIGTSTCGGGGPHMVDIRDPEEPTFAGCVSEDGYTHDTQCVNYEGPDGRFAGQEICFNSNEDTVTIVDVTDKENPQQLSRTGYETAAYTHQGWLTPDQRYLIVDDELDEQEQGGQTKSYIFDVAKLDAPVLIGVYNGVAESIDHNMYTKGNRVFQANYRSGLRILDTSRVSEGSLREVGFFDVYPPDDEAEFNGAWSNYPYFESGNVVVSGIEQGLFVVKPQGRARPR
ncbi:MAG: choice-of-anchor B family protein [Thermoleophilaceae bacterium]